MNFFNLTKLPRAANALLLVSFLANAQPALAIETICDGVITASTLDDVAVQTGASCTLMNVTIEGNFNATDADAVTIIGGRIDGNVDIVGSTGDIIIDGTDIAGNVTAKDSTSNFVNVRSTHVNGNIRFRNNVATAFNSGPPSLFFIVNNTVYGNIKMRKNQADVMLLGSCGQRPEGARFSNVVGGNLTVTGNRGNFVVTVNCSDVIGNVRVKNNVALGLGDGDDADVQVDFNAVDGNVNVVGNRARDQVQLTGNTISGNLRCKQNNPAPRTDNAPDDPSIPADAPVKDGNTVGGKIRCSS